ncbi:hypothetical protein DWS25_20240 [Escherichia coli]|nr:hypothetical protein [Escherichia coli]HDV3419763.1 hypothetical protein [Escherichia coli]HDX5578612.1 hypothetical protein [Escherichia coli]HDX7413009.1 hypothetical protein [Escherichia coli]
MAYTMQPRRHHAATAVQQRREQDNANEAKQNEPEGQPQTSQPQQGGQPQQQLNVPQFSIPSATDAAATGSLTREQQLEQELAMYKQRLGDLEDRLQGEARTLPEDVQKELEELRKYRDDYEMQQLLAVDQEFEAIDRDAAAELSAKVLRPALERLEKRYEDKLRITQEELARDRKERQTRDAGMTEAQKNAERAKTNAAILGAHPDFESIIQSTQFAEFSTRPAWKGSRVTLGQLMRDEYNNGNADFVIEALNDYKSGKPSLADIASVSTTTTASAPASNSDEQQYTEEDVSSWNRKLATGQMTRAEYKELRAKYKAQKVAAQTA